MTTHNPKEPHMDTAAQIMADITANSPALQGPLPTRPRGAKRTQFLKDVLITAVEGGINYWSQVSDYDPEAGTVIVWEDENEDGTYTKRHEVTIDTIAHGIRVLTTGENAHKAFSMSGADYWQQFLLANRTNSEEGDYDADIADNVLQAGIFGEVVYG